MAQTLSSMPDFHQPGPVISLPLLGPGDTSALERDLLSWISNRPLALLLPCHVRDLGNPALTGIIETLAEIPWVTSIIAGVDGATEAEFAGALRRFAPLGSRCECLWNDSAAVGKGRNLWRLAGHLLNSRSAFAAAMHDCDIRTYSRGFLARLCWPVLHPDAGITACKGYYARTDGQLHGRVFRLMFQPLLRAVTGALGHHAWLTFLNSFRYPLSGELCLQSSLLGQLAFDPGWGVEIRLLHSLYRHAGAGMVCQAELCPAYDHKHHEAPGLERMAEEIAATLRQTLTEENLRPEPLLTAGFMETFSLAVNRALLESRLMSAMSAAGGGGSEESSLAALLTTAAFRGLSAGGAPAPLPPPQAQKNPDARSVRVH